VLFYIQEAEGLTAMAAKSDKRPFLKEIAGSDLLMPFVFYEVLAVNQPARIAASPEYGIKKMIAYIDKFH
jgi:hypothetical protein